MYRTALLVLILAGMARASAFGATPLHANLAYGPHEWTILDVYLAEAEEPTPLVIAIHGSGFGQRFKGLRSDLLQALLDQGISVATITYRLTDEVIAPAMFHDAARAVQFMRHNAERWNLDPERFAAMGGSAGAGLSLWLAFHDDLADPGSEDPVLRESTRLSCVVAFNGQTTYDLRVIRDLFPEYPVYKDRPLQRLFDVDPEQLDRLPREKYALFEEVSAMTHFTPDDPPVMLHSAYPIDAKIESFRVGIHHPRFGLMLKEPMDNAGVECQMHYVRQRNKEPIEPIIDFLTRRLGRD